MPKKSLKRPPRRQRKKQRKCKTVSDFFRSNKEIDAKSQEYATNGHLGRAPQELSLNPAMDLWMHDFIAT